MSAQECVLEFRCFSGPFPTKEEGKGAVRNGPIPGNATGGIDWAGVTRSVYPLSMMKIYWLLKPETQVA